MTRSRRTDDELRGEVHDTRCISLTDGGFNEHCDCSTLRIIDEFGERAK